MRPILRHRGLAKRVRNTFGDEESKERASFFAKKEAKKLLFNGVWATPGQNLRSLAGPLFSTQPLASPNILSKLD